MTSLDESHAQNALSVCPYCLGPFDEQHESILMHGIRIIGCPAHSRLGMTGLNTKAFSFRHPPQSKQTGRIENIE